MRLSNKLQANEHVRTKVLQSFTPAPQELDVTLFLSAFYPISETDLRFMNGAPGPFSGFPTSMSNVCQGESKGAVDLCSPRFRQTASRFRWKALLFYTPLREEE